MPWKTAGTAGRPCCRADRAESRSPPPPPPRPAPRLHAAEKQQVKIEKLFLIITFLKNISNYNRKNFKKFITFRLGRARCPLLGSPDDGEWADAALPEAAPPGASSPGAAPRELVPAAALESSDAAAPRPLVTAVHAAAAAAPKLAVNAAPTAAPVLRDKRKISTGTII